VPVVLAGYFLLNFIVRMSLPHVLELDEAEQTYFSQWLLGGYSSQPPFYNWMQYAAVQLFGISLPTLAVLKNLLLFGSYIFYWLAAREVMRDRLLAAVAALGLLTVPQIAFEAQRDLSHTVATIFASSFFLYALLRTLKRPSLAAFLLLGLATGIGGIAKYNFIVLPIAAFATILSDAQWRRRLLDWRVLLAGAIAFVIVLPHALWLIDNFQATSSHTMRKLVGNEENFVVEILEGFGSLILACLGFGALTVVVFALVWRERLREIARASNEWTRLTGRVLVLSIGVIVLMILFAGVENVRDRWLTPVLLILPLYLALKVDAAGTGRQPGLSRIWGVAFVIMLLIPSILFGRIVSAPLTGVYQYQNYPFPALADTIRPIVSTKPTLIISANGYIGGNLRFNLPSTPVMTFTMPTGIRSFPLPPHEQILFVWGNRDGATPSGFPKEFADYLQESGLNSGNVETNIVGFPYNYGRPGDEYRFAYALVNVAP